MDIVCFSHLRWDFVYQRPQHLLSRFANIYRVFYVEEAFYQKEKDEYISSVTAENVTVIQISLVGDEWASDVIPRYQQLLNRIFEELEIGQEIFWYYTPMALRFSGHLHPSVIVYDCMDELSAFKFASPKLKEMEALLFEKADVVFTGGYSLYEAKKNRHDNVFAFPSSIDKSHFEKARYHTTDPDDQAFIPHPRFGFYGVLDERFDIGLINDVAVKKPDWHFIFIGPIVKISEESLPHHPNVHYLGSKTYNELPTYLSSWDVAMLCFAINESTRFISPTKTPEYLAAGKPVISTPIRDVVKEYSNLVFIANGPDEFIHAGEAILNSSNNAKWLVEVDDHLANKSWNKTAREIQLIIQDCLADKLFLIQEKQQELYV